MSMTDSELTQLEAMEFSRPCAPWDSEICPNEAKWLLKIKCCAAEMPLCDDHKSERETWWEDNIINADAAGFYCDNCGCKYYKPIDDVRHAVWFERI